MDHNQKEQEDELEALSAVFGDDWQKEQAGDNSYSMTINRDVKLFITLNSEYPSTRAPTYELLAPILNAETKQKIYTSFKELSEEYVGMPVLFQWIEKLKDLIESENNTSIIPAVEEQEKENIENNEDIKKELTFNIIHGSIIQDRKSTFQGHACSITTQQEVKDVMEVLKQNKKIAQATHNILAYRIALPNGSLLQDCDDDGESHAGGRLLHLLQILDVANVVVIVSRWYGGIHLGPDRFRHINNSARQVLQEAGFIKDKTT